VTQKNKVTVKIANKNYTIVGSETENYIQKIALYVDKKISELQKTNTKLSTSMSAVLSCVNVADEYFKMVESEAKATAKSVSVESDLNKSLELVEKMTKEIEKLNEKNVLLTSELEKKELELSEYISSFERNQKVRFYSK
jgi:cell division protein ZapA